MKFTWILILSCGLAPIPTFAKAAKAKATKIAQSYIPPGKGELPTAEEIAESEEAVYQAYLPAMKTLAKGFSTFHWEESKSSYADKFNPKTKEGALALAKDMSKSFLETNSAHGFYLATDPSISRFYTKLSPSWRLMKVDIPAGLKYLDLLRGEVINLQNRLKDSLPRGCQAHLHYFVDAQINASYSPGICADLKKRAFRRLGIEAIRYGWDEPKMIEQCSGRDNSAFVLIGGDWLNEKNFTNFTEDSTNFSAERKAIHEYTVNAPTNWWARETWIWKDFSKDAPVTEETLRWAQKNLVNCQKDNLIPAAELNEPTVEDAERGEQSAR